MPPKYKPGGKKLTPAGITKSLPKQIINRTSTASSEVLASSGLDQEAEDKFELELCWCIEQLQISLNSGKIGEKQSLDGVKTLNLLKSSTVPLIAKRQAMRSTFGDYRAKMAQEEKKHGRYVSNFKFSESKLSTGKSVFLKKAADNSTTKNTVNNRGEESIVDLNNKGKINCKKTFIMSKEPSNVPFRFNFCPPECK